MNKIIKNAMILTAITLISGCLEPRGDEHPL